MPGRPLRSLTGWARWACTATIVVFTLAPTVCALRAVGQGWQATGDIAVIGIRSLDAWTSKAPLVGQPTTGQERTGIESSHPGPAENWWLGPMVRVLGPSAGIVVGMAVLDGLALGACCWLAFRRGGPVLLALTAVFLALLVHALGSASLYDAYNSEVPTYPLLATALAAWSVLARDLEATPVLVVAASFAAQAHVAGATTALPLVLLAAGALGWLAWRHRSLLARARTPLLLALGLGVVLWLPPLAQELSAGPSNVSALARTATAGGPTLGLAYTAERVATAVSPVPLFARRSGSYGFLADRSALGVLLAALVIGGAGSLAVLVQQRDRRRRGPLLLALVTGVALVTSALVWSGSPPVSAFRVDSIRWLWVVGLLVWLTSLWAAWHLVPPAARAVAVRGAPVAAGGVAALLLVVAAAGVSPGSTRDGRAMPATGRLAAAVTRELPTGRYHLRFDGSESLVTVGPGIAYRLVDAGYGITVDPGPFGRAYGPSRTRGGQAVRGTVAIVNGEPTLGAGDRLLARDTFRSGSGPVTISVVLEAP